jgi:hypothetical protein
MSVQRGCEEDIMKYAQIPVRQHIEICAISIPRKQGSGEEL